MPEVIDVTGEVISPDHDNITPLFMRHMAAYKFFREHVRGRKVLEIGFGEGYGTYYLSEVSKEITGIDVSHSLVEHAKSKYSRENLYFIRSDAATLPFPDSSFDVVVSSQVLEHVKDYMGFLRETARVLKPGGTALVATPNRMMMIDGVNPYHFKEFSAKELASALKKVFNQSEVLGLAGKRTVHGHKGRGTEVRKKDPRLRLHEAATVPAALHYTPTLQEGVRVGQQTYGSA